MSEPIRINIPNARPAADSPNRAAAEFIAMLREAGIDPLRGYANAMVRGIFREWDACRISRGEAMNALRNLRILNGGLAV